MYLFNYYTHNRLSFDACAPLSKLTEATTGAGLDKLRVTGHFSFLSENGVPAEGYSWAPAVIQHQQALPAAGERLALRLGLELGVPHLNPAATAAICAHPGADFILGSIHNLSPERDGTDLFFPDFSAVQACYDALDGYFTSLALLVATDLHDILTHLIYPLCYMQTPVALNRYQDAIQAILHTAVEKGRGIRVNTCRGHTLEEWRPILALYRDYGGEIITIGSDARTPADVGKGIRAAYVLLRERGSRHVCTYEKHQLMFHTLG